jgi:hypothetical protein
MLAALIVLAWLAPPADAASILYTGTFNTALTAVPGIPSSISGTFTFIFDESTVPPSGPAAINLTPGTVTMTMLGSTTFTPANTGVILDYFNGSFIDAMFGGTLNGVGTVMPGTNDFLVKYQSSLSGAGFGSVVASTTTASATAHDTPPSFGTIQATALVPEPSSLFLAGTAALAGLGAWARRRARRSTSRIG